ncbi:MAG: hypothetical protein IH984_05200 [Planctomycetes bacterium]|nr:hypothetical protein [Planctomycetota bacterium]
MHNDSGFGDAYYERLSFAGCEDFTNEYRIAHLAYCLIGSAFDTHKPDVSQGGGSFWFEQNNEETEAITNILDASDNNN